jgi:hypothetical protein
MKNFKIFQDVFEEFGQNISKIFKNKHPINNHPRGWV